jgi:hypothetical protein
MRWWWCPNTLSCGFFNSVISLKQQSAEKNMSSHSDTLFWFRANQFYSLSFSLMLKNSILLIYASFHPIYTVRHSTNTLKACPIHITVKNVLLTITSSVTNQTGSCGTCSLRQSTWSINENTGVFARVETTRTHHIMVN